MKKQYIMPQIVVATISATTILAGSDPLATPVDQRPSSDVSASTPSSPSDNQFSKHSFDLWDDEE